jgi:hypothetical protein
MPYDIITNRRSCTNLGGNRLFRETIQMNLQLYIDTPTIWDKFFIIKSITNVLVHNDGVRFLRKVRTTYIPFKKKPIIIKVGEAFDMLENEFL